MAATVDLTSTTASAQVLNAVGLGNGSSALGNASTALGSNAQALTDGSVALGSGSVADRLGLRGATEAFSNIPVNAANGAISVGSPGNERQIINVAGGTAPTDAVNVRQLASVGNTLANTLGGGAGFNATTNAFTAPTYVVSGTQFNNVGSAISALNASGLRYDINPITGQNTNSVTLVGGDVNTPVTIHNVANGILRTDVANTGQVIDAQTNVLNYTNQQVAIIDNSINNINNRLNVMQGEIDQTRREAHQGAAVGLAAASLRFDDRPGRISIAAGGGYWRGEGAAAFGAGYTMPNGAVRMNVTAAATATSVGVGGGATFTLN